MEKQQTLVAGAKKPGILTRAGLAVAAFLAPVLAFAQTTGTDYSPITNAVDWSSVTTGVIAILALGAAVVVVFVGGKMLISAIKGSK